MVSSGIHTTAFNYTGRCVFCNVKLASLIHPAGTAGCQLEHLGSPPCVHLCKPNWLSCSMVVSGQSSNRASPNGLAQLTQPITMGNDVPLAKASYVAKTRINLFCLLMRDVARNLWPFKICHREFKQGSIWQPSGRV